jgi:catechol 2,3-dioxygenase-like lactoylglutathione lyase family enzyme
MRRSAGRAKIRKHQGTPMARQIAGIDHAIVGVRDLEQARASYQRLGFRVTPRGRHVGWGTANYCVMFERDYLELLGIVDDSQFTNNLDRFLAEREGLLALALRSTDARATQEAWQAAGLAPAEVAALGRQLEPDTELRFENVMLPPEATGGAALFACAALTPEAMRQPAWLAHPNGAQGIASVTVAAEDPNAFYEPMAQVFGSICLTETDDTLAVHTGRGVLLFATPDDLDMLHPEMDAIETGGAPMLAAISLTVPDLAATAAWLDHHDIAYRRDSGGTIGVPSSHTHGVMLEFVAAGRIRDQDLR